MKRTLSLVFTILLFVPCTWAQQKTDFAVELAAFDRSVPLSYFKGIKGVYETYDINQIYRYHIATQTQAEAVKILQEVQNNGFPNARIIDFESIRKVCESRCGYIAPQRTGIGINIDNPSINVARNVSNQNAVAANSNNSSNNNNTPSNPKSSISIDATALLGENAEEIPEELLDPQFQEFVEQNANLGLTDQELIAIYKKHGNIKIDQADWFSFKNKNSEINTSNEELIGFYVKHGNIKITTADWFVFKTKSRSEFDTWKDFKNKNKALDAIEEELMALYEKHGNIRISNAIWFAFQENRSDYPVVVLDNFSSPATIETVGFVMFEFGGTQISPTTLSELQKVASALLKNKNLNIQLIGHADAIGNAYANKVLSLQRANTIKQHLTQKGVAATRMSARGRGEADPIAINKKPDGTDSPQGRKYNRRVDLLVLDPQGNPVNIVSSIQIPKSLLYK